MDSIFQSLCEQVLRHFFHLIWVHCECHKLHSNRYYKFYNARAKNKNCGTQASEGASVLPFLRFVANDRIYVYHNNQTITFVTLTLKNFCRFNN